MLMTTFCWQAQAVGQQKHFVELEVISSSHVGIDQNQRWLKVLSGAGADRVKISQTPNQGARPSVDKVKDSFGTTYKIVGVLDSRNRLVLPGGTFSVNDKAGIRKLMGKIKDDGAEVALAEKMAFGLTAEQLVALHTDLSGEYTRETKDQAPRQVLQLVKYAIKTPVLIDSGAKAALSSDYQLRDELQGLTNGTVLAAALRPIGLVVAPRRLQGKTTEIVITPSQSVEEHWPIGWPLQVRKDKAVPKLFDRIPTNIRSFPLDQALNAIQANLKIPFLYDYNSMARSGVELNKIRVNVQADKLAYQLILQRVISQARPRMRMELRADEAGKPFMWFSAR